MPIVAQGGSVTLNANVGHANGNPADDAALTLTILDSLGAPVAGFPVAIPPIVRTDLGTYHYVWSVPALLALGDYTATWDATVDGADAGGSEQVEVVAPGTIGGPYLCTLDDVRALTHVDNPTDTTDDATLTDLMGSATDLIHTITGRYFLPDSGATYYFDGQWSSPYTLTIPRGIRSVTTLKTRTGTGGTLSAALGATEYGIRPHVQDRAPGEPGFRIDLTEIASVNFAPFGSEVIEIVGDFGYAAVPPTIERIARETVLRAFRRRGSGMGESLSGPGTPASYISWAMTYEDRKMLEDIYSPVRVR